MNKIDWSNAEAVKKYHSEFNKGWYQKNKVKRSKQIKEYAQSHKEDSVKRTQKYTAKNKEKVYSYGKEYNQTVQGGYRSYKCSSLKREKEFNLTPDEFAELVGQPCTYCGEDSKRIGIDRVDNSKGYSIGNCVPCCKNCNYMKKNLIVTDFLSHIMKIANYNK